MIRRGFLKLLCAGNFGVLAASVSSPLKLLGVEDVPEPEKIPDSPIVLPGVGLQGHIRSVSMNVDAGLVDCEDVGGAAFIMPGLQTVTLSFDLMLSPSTISHDSLQDMLAGGYVHILSAKPPNEMGA